MKTMTIGDLEAVAADVKLLFAPLDAQPSHLACLSLDEFLARVRASGVGSVSSPESEVSKVLESMMPAEFAGLARSLIELVVRRRSCIDCLTLDAGQLREMLGKRNTTRELVPLVQDGLDYPLSLDMLIALVKCKPEADSVAAASAAV